MPSGRLGGGSPAHPSSSPSPTSSRQRRHQGALSAALRAGRVAGSPGPPSECQCSPSSWGVRRPGARRLGRAPASCVFVSLISVSPSWLCLSWPLTTVSGSLLLSLSAFNFLSRLPGSPFLPPPVSFITPRPCQRFNLRGVCVSPSPSSPSFLTALPPPALILDIDPRPSPLSRTGCRP